MGKSFTIDHNTLRDFQEFKKRVEDVRNVHKIQGSEGNWDYDPYMCGLYNGLEMALATLERRDPVFKDARDTKEYKERINNEKDT